jgi:hypothetical protein
MSRGVALPATPDAITPALLSQMLSTRFPGAEAESVEIVDAHSGTTGRARLRVRWRSGADAPEAIFAKLAPTDPLQKQMVVATGMGRREARFYAELAERVPSRVAAPYCSEWSDDGSTYLMLIEDLAASGCSFPSWEPGRSGEEDLSRTARGMMESLAELHAAFWQSPLFENELAWIEPPMRSALGPMLVTASLEQFAGEMPPVFRELGELYCEHVEPISDLLDEGPQTLLHGDAHLGNIFLDSSDGERVGLLDWACTARGPGLRDVSYFLCNSTPTELRRREERALLGTYLEGLAKRGIDAPSQGDAFLQHRRLAVTSWVAATATAAVGDRMQPIAVGRRAMQRATDAALDLDTLSLLREELGIS